MIVVATRQSASPRRNESIVPSSSPSSICPWASAKRTPGHRARRRSVDLVQRVDAVVQEESLPLAGDLALDRARDQLLVVGADVGAHRAPALRRRLDHRDVAQAGEAHLQGAGDRRRRQREHVDLELELAQELLLLDPEALLLVDDHEAEVLRAHVAREQPVGADQDVHAAVGEAGERLADLGRLAQPRDHLDLERVTMRGARGRCRGAAGRGSSSAPASSPACPRRPPCARPAARPPSCRSRRRRRSAGPSAARTPCRPSRPRSRRPGRRSRGRGTSARAPAATRRRARRRVPCAPGAPRRG